MSVAHHYTGMWSPPDVWGYSLSSIDYPPPFVPTRAPYLVPVLGVTGEVFTLAERLELMGFVLDG